MRGGEKTSPFSCTLKKIKLRHASQNSYLLSDIKVRGVALSGNTSEVAWVVSIHIGDIFAVNIATLFFLFREGEERRRRGGGAFCIKTRKGNAKLWRGSVFVYPTQAFPEKTANIQTDANHMMAARASQETASMCVSVRLECVSSNFFVAR